MPPIVIPNTVRLAIIWSLALTDYAVIVLHGTVPQGVDMAAGVQQWGAAIDRAFDTADMETLNGLALDVRIARYTARDLRTANQPEHVAISTKKGGNTNTILPLGVCICVTHRTALAGRSYRGRSYVPGWTESHNTTQGTISAGGQVMADTFFEAMRTELAATIQPFTMVVASRYSNKVLRPTPITTPIISSEVRDLTWDYQRRRAVPGI